MKPRSYHVYVITAAVPELGRTHQDIAEAAIAGGANMLQFRDKEMSNAQFEAAARRLLTLCRTKNVPLIINDRVEIACKIGAAGIHVGHQDMAVSDLRKIVPPEMLLGLSARNYDETLAVAADSPDYLGVGPIFATPSKADASEPIGIDELHRICRTISIPVVAIGGITVANLPQIVEAGVAGAAVISAITHAPDMQRATEDLTSAWQRSARHA